MRPQKAESVIVMKTFCALLVTSILSISAAIAATEQEIVNQSAAILRDFRRMPERGIPAAVLREAKGLAIIKVVKVGLGISGKGGEGVGVGGAGESACAARGARPLSRRQFALQRGAHFGTFQDVRTTVALLALLAAGSRAIAQEQEGKLIDRVLKPNMSLANPAQNKQFIAPGIVTGKRAVSKSFYAPEKPNVRIFAIDRVITPTEFASRHFRTGESTAIVVSRAPVIKADAVYSTNSTPDIRVASGS